MSREIKFRAFIKHLQILVKIESIDFITKMVEVDLTGGEGDATWFTFENVELVQYTGLKDKNGKEIYEGDIVEYNDFNSLKTGGHAEDKIIVGKVIFSCGMWMVEENNCGHDLYEGLVNDEELEVIGNIYKHKHLLEETA